MNPNLQYKIGTRGSLLAFTQCNLIKEEIEQKTGANFELLTIKTQGDQIQDKPLWQLEGKDFFTKELDSALLTKKVDLVVHSYKDLGSERPEGITLETITKRHYAHDILLIKKTSIEKLNSKSELIIGTSSPRRMTNLNNYLSQYIPSKNHLEVKCQSIRGNINSRIEKLKSQDMDAIVLALAGLERLASKEEAKAVLVELLEGLEFMILPQSIFPSAASQGALAIECLDTADSSLKENLASVHHEITALEMKREREAFKSYGGGCHLAVGINVRKLGDYFIHTHRGSVDDKLIEKRELEGFDYTELKGKKVYFVFGKYDFLIHKDSLSFHSTNSNTFVTSSHCFHGLTNNHISLWASGNRTMRKLTEKGFWVNGCAEGLGHERIDEFRNSKAIQLLLKTNEWTTLSHDKASTNIGKLIPCYTHKLNSDFNETHKEDLINADIVYWSSIIQYEHYLQHFPEIKNKRHACGLGKTLKAFESKNIAVIPCIDMKHLKEKVQEL